MDAIPIIKRAFIMRILRSQGNYEVTSRGRHIRLFRSEKDQAVHYRVGRGPRNVVGEAPSTGDAIDNINRIIAGGFQPRAYQLPYRDDL